jgi:hypothetical protein
MAALTGAYAVELHLRLGLLHRDQNWYPAGALPRFLADLASPETL